MNLAKALAASKSSAGCSLQKGMQDFANMFELDGSNRMIGQMTARASELGRIRAALFPATLALLTPAQATNLSQATKLARAGSDRVRPQAAWPHHAQDGETHAAIARPESPRYTTR